MLIKITNDVFTKKDTDYRIEFFKDKTELAPNHRVDLPTLHNAYTTWLADTYKLSATDKKSFMLIYRLLVASSIHEDKVKLIRRGCLVFVGLALKI